MKIRNGTSFRKINTLFSLLRVGQYQPTNSRSSDISTKICDCKNEPFPLTRPSRRPPPRCIGDQCIGGQRQNFVPLPTPGQALSPPLRLLPRVRRLLQSRRRCYSSPRLRPPPRYCPIPPSFLSANRRLHTVFWGRGPRICFQIKDRFVG